MIIVNSKYCENRHWGKSLSSSVRNRRFYRLDELSILSLNSRRAICIIGNCRWRWLWKDSGGPWAAEPTFDDTALSFRSGSISMDCESCISMLEFGAPWSAEGSTNYFRILFFLLLLNSTSFVVFCGIFNWLWALFCWISW